MQGDTAVVKDDLLDAVFKMFVVVLVGGKGGDEDHAFGLLEARVWLY